MRPSFKIHLSAEKFTESMEKDPSQLKSKNGKIKSNPTAIVRLAGIENSLTGHYCLPISNLR
ncbi:MAG: hypothetical protein DMG06_13410 [Acidobacteria bacterium]|nr:MAG: hypothetical protein DMG06_13410 [Acidobacteriota bacterium]